MNHKKITRINLLSDLLIWTIYALMYIFNSDFIFWVFLMWLATIIFKFLAMNQTDRVLDSWKGTIIAWDKSSAEYKKEIKRLQNVNRNKRK